MYPISPLAAMPASVVFMRLLLPFARKQSSMGTQATQAVCAGALVEVRVPKTVPLQQVTLFLNGRDVTATFRTDAAERVMRGVLTGLVPRDAGHTGQNEFLADANGRGLGRPRASLTITNHPIGGPVLLGSQTTPWVCATPTPVAESGNTPASNASGLTTTAFDAQCNIATEYKLFYRTTTAGCSSALPDPSPPAPPPTNNCFKP